MLLAAALLATAAPGVVDVDAGAAPFADLAGSRWLFHDGDDVAWAAPAFDDSAWQSVVVPAGIGKQGHADLAGFFWYRVHLKIDGARGRQLSLQLGMIDSAYELWFDGERAGVVGSLPPGFTDAHDVPRLWPIPPHALDDGEVVVAIRGFRSAQRAHSNPERGGLWREPVAVGDSAALIDAAWTRDRDNVVASFAIFIVGLYHLQLFRRRRSERGYLWFGVFCVFIAGNLRLETEATHAIDTVLRAKLVFSFLVPAPALFVQFLWPFLGERVPLFCRAVQAALVAYALLIVAWPTTWFVDVSMPWFELGLIVPLMLVTASFIVKKAWRGDREARTLLLGTLALVAAAGWSALTDRAIITLPLTLPYAMILFVLSMAFSLSNRFARTYAELDRMAHLAEEVRHLNAHVQANVRERSAELSTALQKLVETGGFGGVVEGTMLDGRYVIERVLGKGGMGTVYAGRDIATDAKVAIKVVQASSLPEAEALHRFLREARAAVAVDHPGVVRMLHVDISADGLFYQVQELVEGETLDARLQRGPVDEGTAARIASIVADALACAHERGVIHRDVKPSNIMITQRAPGVKLLDFGVAKIAASSEQTSTGRMIGTPAFMAPEQRLFGDGDITDRVDVFALGVVLSRMGALPEVAAECTRDDAKRRPSARELADRLREFADGRGAPAQPAVPSELSGLLQELARTP